MLYTEYQIITRKIGPSHNDFFLDSIHNGFYNSTKKWGLVYKTCHEFYENWGKTV
jgi:hypothetical protein